MSTTKKIVANSFVLSVTELASRLLSLVLIMAIARTLGPRQTGIYAFCIAVAGVLSVAVNFGSDIFVKREIGRNPSWAKELMGNLAALKIILFIGAASIIAFIAFVLIHEEPKRSVLLIMTGTLFFQSQMQSAFSFFRAFLKARYESFCGIGLRFSNTAIGLAALKMGYGIYALAAVETAAQAIACGIAWLLLTRMVKGDAKRISLRKVGRLAASVWRLALLQMTQSLFTSIDMLLLPLRANDVAAGLYGAAQRFCGAFAVIPNAIANPMLSVLSRAAIESRQRHSELVESYIKYSILLGAAVCFILACFAREILTFLYGARFIDAVPVMRIMAVTDFIIFVNFSLSNALYSVDRESLVTIIFVLTGVATALMNYVLIPPLRESGAALAMAAAQLALAMVQFRFLRTVSKAKIRIVRHAAGPLAVCGLAFAVSLAADSLGMRLWAKAIVLPVIFSTGLFATGSIGAGELRNLGILMFSGRKAPS